MGAIFVDLTQSERKRETVRRKKKAIEIRRQRKRAKLGLKWPIHLQCPSFIV